MNALLGGPAVDEEADGQNHGAGHRDDRAEASLGRVLDVSGLVPEDDGVGEGAEEGDADHHTDARGQEGEADGSLVEAVMVLVDEREGRDEEVENAVDDGHVESHEGDDGRHEEELQRADDGVLERVAHFGISLELAPEVLVARFLAESFRLALEDEGGVGLLDEEPGERDKDAALRNG